MNVTLHKLLCFSLALLLASTPLTRAQQTSITAPAPIPPQITSAHTVFIANGGGTNYFNAFTGGADRGYSQLFTTVQQWNRYQIVDSPSQADLIFEIHAVAPLVRVAGDDGSVNPQLILRILDPKTNAPPPASQQFLRVPIPPSVLPRTSRQIAAHSPKSER